MRKQNADTRYFRADSAEADAKFYVECYGKQLSLLMLNDQIDIEDDEHKRNHWLM